MAAVSMNWKIRLPLVMGVEARENESFQLYLAYPDLLNENASEHALASDAYWEGTVTDLFEGMRQMSENSSKNPDLNHLKVLLLNPQVFASDAAMEALLSFFEKKTDAAWNTYVLLTEEPMQEIFTEKLQLPECMGIYLEDLLEEWEHVKHNSFVTVGTLMQQFYERKGTVCIPKVVRQEEKLAIGGFAILEQLHLAGNLSLEEGYEALLLQNNLKKYAFFHGRRNRSYVRTASGAARYCARTEEGTMESVRTLLFVGWCRVFCAVRRHKRR